MHRSAALASASASALALVCLGCSTGGGPEAALPSEWAGLPARDPVPTGITVVGSRDSTEASPGAIVADGSGMVWVGGPAQITRLDTSTGRSDTWDIADDTAFGSRNAAPSSGTGVWLARGLEAHLFNGERFLADLTVPAELLDGPGDPASAWIDDLAEAGETLWISTFESVPGEDGGAAGRVLRWSDGQWTQVSAPEDGASGTIAVDTQGGVWVGGRNSPPVGVEPGIKRWDGARWTKPGADDPGFPRGTGEVVADPTGGVWFLESTGGPVHLSRFDGTRWHLVSDDVIAQVGEAWAAHPLVVSNSGEAWMAGSSAVVRFATDGSTHSYAAEQGVVPEYGSVPAVTIAGDDVLVHQLAGVLRLTGERFTPVLEHSWSPDRTAWLTAVSTDEVWTQAQRAGEPTQVPGAPAGVVRKPTGWVRWRNGAWQEVGASTTGMCSAALATDGAVWIGTADGLVRASGDDVEVVWPGLPDCGVLAGAAGSVWVLSEGNLVGVRPDGTRVSIGRPGGFEDVGMWAAGADGSLVVGGLVDGADGFARWDGAAWSRLEVPDPAYLSAMAITDDGATWATFVGDDADDPKSRLGRFADGAWTFFRVYLWTIDAMSGNRVWGETAGSGGTIVCFDANGETSRHDLPELDLQGAAIAPDGAVWSSSGQVARLPWQIPTD